MCVSVGVNVCGGVCVSVGVRVCECGCKCVWRWSVCVSVYVSV